MNFYHQRVPISLKEQSAKVVNIAVKFYYCLEILKKERMLPSCLVEYCQRRYANDVTLHQYGVRSRIHQTPSYTSFRSMLKAFVYSDDKLEIHWERHIIEEKLVFEERGISDSYGAPDPFRIMNAYWKVVCCNCRKLYYSDENIPSSVTIDYRERTDFIPLSYIFYMANRFWCNDCFKPLFKIPNKNIVNARHDVILQICKPYGKEIRYKLQNCSLDSSSYLLNMRLNEDDYDPLSRSLSSSSDDEFYG